MKRLICFVLVLVLAATPLFAKDGNLVPPISFADLATKADVIVLAQVKDTDYLYRHEYPVSGSAYLKVLIPYKVDQSLDIVEVFEEGLHAAECYFPNPTVLEEGRRYLLFLNRDPDRPERYRGLAQGCALDVLVASDNRYLLRYPVTGIELSDSLQEHAVETQFSDPYALESEDSLASDERSVLLETGLLTPFESAKSVSGVRNTTPIETAGRQWIYTRGIDLLTVRNLMDLDHTDPKALAACRT